MPSSEWLELELKREAKKARETKDWRPAYSVLLELYMQTRRPRQDVDSVEPCGLDHSSFRSAVEAGLE